jgi:hypothetical protein
MQRVSWPDGAVKALGKGHIYRVEGKHRSGNEYWWGGSWHPCDLGPDHLKPITKAQDLFFTRLVDLLERFGIKLGLPRAASSSTPPNCPVKNDDALITAAKQENIWKPWWNGGLGFGPELIPGIPHDGELHPESDALPGKTPGELTEDGWIGMRGKWSDNYYMTEDKVVAAHRLGCGVGMQGRKYPGLDIDVNDPALADKVEQLAFEILGSAPVRYRDGSARRLLMYRVKEGEPTFKKRSRKAWKIGEPEDKEKKQLIELLGKGQYFNCEGMHPSGKPYKWRDGWHPCDRGPEGPAANHSRANGSLFCGTVVRAGHVRVQLGAKGRMQVVIIYGGHAYGVIVWWGNAYQAGQSPAQREVRPRNTQGVVKRLRNA